MTISPRIHRVHRRNSVPDDPLSVVDMFCGNTIKAIVTDTQTTAASSSSTLVGVAPSLPLSSSSLALRGLASPVGVSLGGIGLGGAVSSSNPANATAGGGGGMSPVAAALDSSGALTIKSNARLPCVSGYSPTPPAFTRHLSHVRQVLLYRQDDHHRAIGQENKQRIGLFVVVGGGGGGCRRHGASHATCTDVDGKAVNGQTITIMLVP